MNFEQVLLLPILLNLMMERILINPGSIVEKKYAGARVCCWPCLYNG